MFFRKNAYEKTLDSCIKEIRSIGRQIGICTNVNDTCVLQHGWDFADQIDDRLDNLEAMGNGLIPIFNETDKINKRYPDTMDELLHCKQLITDYVNDARAIVKTFRGRYLVLKYNS